MGGACASLEILLGHHGDEKEPQLWNKGRRKADWTKSAIIQKYINSRLNTFICDDKLNETFLYVKMLV